MCYFIPPRKDVQEGYRPKALALPAGLTEEEIAAQCRRLWLDLLDWRLARPKGSTRYTIAWLADRYLSDKDSPYQGLGPRAQRSYAACCRAIVATVGKRRIDPDGRTPRILGAHVREWYREWGTPAEGKTEPRPARARHLIVQLRILMSYAVELGTPGAIECGAMLSKMRFSQPAPRGVAPSREQVADLVRAAIDAGYPSIAMTTLAQFELIERRTHIIGMYVNKVWRPGWIWSAIEDGKPIGISADWNITYFQTKIGKVERTFDLKIVPQLLKLLQAVPQSDRNGPVIKDEHSGEPWRERHYAEVFRVIATAAGWPENLKSMDLRAGGATEADAIGVSDRQLQDAGGWKDPRTKDRYRRAPQRNAQNVVDLRQKANVSATTLKNV